MSDQFGMFEPTTSEATSNAISSPALESGVTPSDSADGKTAGPSGPRRVRANPSQTPAKKKRSTTKGIFGQSSFHSSEHDDLSFALASKLRPLTDSLGSTLFTLTWVTRVTPQGLSICALRASEAPTGANVCIGWPTPRARAAGPDHAIVDRPASGGFSVETATELAAWPTPTKGDGDGGHMLPDGATPTGRRPDGSKATVSLAGVARFASWTTPKARDHKTESDAACSLERMADHPPDLSKQARLASWTTPQAADSRGATGPASTFGDLSTDVRKAAWPTPTAEDAESSGMRHSRGVADTMTAVANLASWTTPSHTDGTRGGGSGITPAMTGSSLSQLAMMSGWPTPIANPDAPNMGKNRGGGVERRRISIQSLGLLAQMAAWQTPKAKTGKYQYANQGSDPDAKQLNLEGQADLVQLTDFGGMPIGFLLGRNGWEILPALGQLRPEHSRWLMGLPPVWDDCAVTAMASLRRSRSRSSKPSSPSSTKRKKPSGSIAQPGIDHHTGRDVSSDT